MMAIARDVKMKRNHSVMSTAIDDTTMMMDIEKGSYYSLEEPASRIWELLETPHSIAEVAAILAAEYEIDDETCEADTAEFVEELIKLELVSAE